MEVRQLRHAKGSEQEYFVGPLELGDRSKAKKRRKVPKVVKALAKLAGITEEDLIKEMEMI